MQNSKKSKIDFRSLEAIKPYSVTIPALIIFCVLGAVSGIDILLYKNRDILLLMFYGLCTSFILIQIFSVYGKQRTERKPFLNFLSDNQWQQSTEDLSGHTPTSVLTQGWYSRLEHAFHGVYRDQPFEARILSYETGVGKLQETHSFVTLQFTTELVFPFIQITQLNNPILAEYDFSRSLPGTVELKLEGRFNERYGVSVTPGAETEALKMLTPDFMQELIDLPLGSNLEFADTSFFVMAAFGVSDMQLKPTKLLPAIQNAFTVSDAIFKQVHDITKSWQRSYSLDEIANIAAAANRPRALSSQDATDW